MLILLLRHGETQPNTEKRYLGITDAPLSPRGRAALHPAGLSPKIVYTSPLLRARQTAELLFPGSRQIPVPGLSEMNFGKFEGKNYAEMEHDADYCAWVDGGCLGTCPGGESRAQFAERTCAAFAALMDEALRTGAEQLVIVAHGGTQMALLERHALPHRDYYDWRTDFGGGFLLDGRDWTRDRRLHLLREVRYGRD